MMGSLKRIRPSNLIILVAMPFILYVFFTSGDYQQSLRAIIGIEDGAPRLLRDFLLLVALVLSGISRPALLLRSRWRANATSGHLFRAPINEARQDMWRNLAILAAWLNLLLAPMLAWLLWHDMALTPLLDSVIANSVDPYTSSLIVKAELPRRLTPEALLAARQALCLMLLAYAGCTAMLQFILAMSKGRPALIAAWGLICLNGSGLAYLLLAAHLGFALGLFTSLRAAIFAYGLACILGLTWAGLLNYAPGARTFVIFPLIVLALLAGAAFYLLQAPVAYDLIGSLEGRVAIIKGTPQPLIDQVRHGDFPHAEIPGVNTNDFNVRTVLDVNQALSVLSAKQGVTAALLPHAALTDPAIVAASGHLWSTQLLPDAARIPGLSLLILGIGLGLLTFGAWQNDRHPLAVAAEFIIDTVRGIPMLVIILYIGLPVSGAIKDATGGAIDMSNVARGVIALALCYSAYLAEIFRAGIEAIPHGQVEAARSLGLSRWQAARRIILPQALRIVVPPLGNEFIAIMKDSSLLSVLSVRDITQRMREFQSASFLTFAPFNAAAVLYICLTLAAASGIKWIERKYNVKSR